MAMHWTEQKDHYCYTTLSTGQIPGYQGKMLTKGQQISENIRATKTAHAVEGIKLTGHHHFLKH